MRILLKLVLFLSILNSLVTHEIDFSSIDTSGEVYSFHKLELNGDNNDEYIVSFISTNELNNLKRIPNYKATVDTVYFVYTEEGTIIDFEKLEIQHYTGFSINQYEVLKSIYSESDIGPLFSFFFIKDINGNGRDEIYFPIYHQNMAYFVGMEYFSKRMEVILDVDTDAYFKNNFRIENDNSLWVLRWPESSTDTFSIFEYDDEYQKYLEIETGIIETTASDFF